MRIGRARHGDAAAFSTGARVGFCVMPGSKPPPWIMKPSMTRWNTVLS